MTTLESSQLVQISPEQTRDLAPQVQTNLVLPPNTDFIDAILSNHENTFKIEWHYTHEKNQELFGAVAMSPERYETLLAAQAPDLRKARTLPWDVLMQQPSYRRHETLKRAVMLSLAEFSAHRKVQRTRKLSADLGSMSLEDLAIRFSR